MVSAQMLFGVLLGVVLVQRAAELRLARRNEVRAREQGAQEFGARHYPLFFVVHGTWLLMWSLETLRRGPHLACGWELWLGLWIAAEGLRYWSIASLGPAWNTRILVVPGVAPVARGPYRWLRHPNYVAVVLELAALPLVFGAWHTALVIGLANLVLLLGVRIPTEMRALQWAGSVAPRSQ
jgi:methyltransferase